MWLRVQATGIVLLLSFLTKQRWLLPLLCANAVVGLVYMHLERRALWEQGSAVFHTRLHISGTTNIVLNGFFHIFLTIVAAARLTIGRAHQPHRVWLLFLLGICLIDLDAVYPTASGVLPYIVFHAVVTMTVLCLAQNEFSLAALVFPPSR